MSKVQRYDNSFKPFPPPPWADPETHYLCYYDGVATHYCVGGDRNHGAAVFWEGRFYAVTDVIPRDGDKHKQVYHTRKPE